MQSQIQVSLLRAAHSPALVALEVEKTSEYFPSLVYIMTSEGKYFKSKTCFCCWILTLKVILSTSVIAHSLDYFLSMVVNEFEMCCLSF